MASRFCNSYEEAAEYSGFTVEQLKRKVRLRLIGVGKDARNRVIFSKAELDECREKTWVKALRQNQR
jgi:hypothetical protein